MVQRQQTAGSETAAPRRLALAHGPARSGAAESDQHVEWSFPAKAESPGRMRSKLRSVLAAWEVRGEKAEDVLLVATELVANAVDHARTPLRFQARLRAEGLRLTVHDRRADLLPSPTDAGPHSLRGRGLRVIDVLSRCWGCDPAPDGKTVWAELAFP